MKNQCPEFPYFGASYPDARCIDGTLHDLDRCDENGNIYLSDEYNPCPFCNTDEFLELQEGNGYDRVKIIEWMEEIKSKYS